AAWPAPERAALCGDLQPAAPGDLPGFRAVFPRPAAGALGACADCGSHEAGGAPASRGGGRHPPLWPAARLSALKRAGPAPNRRNEKAVYGALIRHSTMLSTSVNPTDGPRFDGGTPAPPAARLIPTGIAADAADFRSWQWQRDFKLLSAK